MYSYYEGGITKTRYGTQITLTILKSLIRANPFQSQIEQLQAMEYGSPEYKKFKQTTHFPCLKPHGSFRNIDGKEQLQKLSGFLYFDIDACDIQAPVEQYKQFLLQTYPEHISMLGKSIGGKGVFFLCKVKGLTEKNFNEVYEYFRTDVFKDLPIDKNATGIARNWFIPYDNNLYCNNEVEIDIRNGNWNEKIVISKKCINQYVYTKKRQRQIQYGIDLYTFPVIESFWDSLVFKTTVNVMDDVFDIRPDGIKVEVRLRKIPDGSKHKSFPVIIWNLMYLNPSLTIQQVMSFMVWFNDNYTCYSPMQFQKLASLVRFCFENYDERKVKLKRKRVWFNPESQMSGKDKRLIAAQVNGSLRVADSIEAINTAALNLFRQGKKINKATVAEQSGMTRMTVHKHWDKCKTTFADLQGRETVHTGISPLKVVKGRDEDLKPVYMVAN